MIRQLEEYTPEAVEQIQSDLSILTGQKINQDIIDEIRTIIETLRSGSADFEAISDEWEHPRTIFHLLLIDSERTDLWKELQSSPELLRSVLTVGRAYSLGHRH